MPVPASASIRPAQDSVRTASGLGWLASRIRAGRRAQQPQAGPGLRRALEQAEIKLIDVGARGGALARLRWLAPTAHYYAVEADRQEAEALQTQLRDAGSWRGATVIPSALWSHDGAATLYVTRLPGLSSLRKPNERVIRRYYRGEEFEVVSTVTVPTLTLEAAARRHDCLDACFLKLDTQGTELDILRSGEPLLRESVLGVQVEVEFHEFYEGQPLFADVDAYLRGFGFTLFDLHRSLHRRAGYRSAWYSRRQVVWAHALYFKDPASARRGSDERQLREVVRLLGLALAFEHHDLATELAGVGESSALLERVYGTAVRDDVEGLVDQRSRAVLGARRGGARRTALTAFTHKDKQHLYE